MDVIHTISEIHPVGSLSLKIEPHFWDSSGSDFYLCEMFPF